MLHVHVAWLRLSVYPLLLLLLLLFANNFSSLSFDIRARGEIEDADLLFLLKIRDYCRRRIRQTDRQVLLPWQRKRAQQTLTGSWGNIYCAREKQTSPPPPPSDRNILSSTNASKYIRNAQRFLLNVQIAELNLYIHRFCVYSRNTETSVTSERYKTF